MTRTLRDGSALLALLDQQQDAVARADLAQASGAVVKVSGPLIQATLPGARVGECCSIGPLPPSGAWLPAEVIGFQDHLAVLSPFGATA